jgi:hypothetical protein
MSAEIVMKAEIILQDYDIHLKIIKPYEIIVPKKQFDIAFNVGGWDVSLLLTPRTNPETKHIITIEGENDKNLKRVYIKSKKIIYNQAEYEYEDIYENIEERQITCKTPTYQISIGYDRNANDKYMDINAETD